eukprot:TRINITY_DN6546_c0_g1_i1.p1 TRINITY_DN6546_c0_g1~~TRINITY_DN6546_c0_g1_i1.p1  ORF type:complete len:453 (-),score=79.11 TRINITY_DN6546_c0_g1_i1:158-1516(-)
MEFNIRACVVAASLIDGTDLGLFPSSFKSLEFELGVKPNALGRLSMVSGLASCCSILIWGFLADNFNRKKVLTRATVVLGVVTLSTSFVRSYRDLAITRVLAGTLAAATLPITQSLVSEVVPASRRGGAFAMLGIAGNISFALSAQLAAVLLWRRSYFAMGILTVILSGILWQVQVDIDGEHKRASGCQATVGEGTPLRATAVLAGEAEKVRRVFQSPTFWAILLGGIVGSIPWNALHFSMMYFQTIGFTGTQAASLISSRAAGQAMGCFFGGHVGDFLAVRCPRHGRAFVAQATILLGMGATWALLQGIPRSVDYFKTYLVVNGLFGLVATWCGPAVDRPLWSEIVPANCRGTIIAWWSFIAGSCGSVFGAPVVGFLAERVYGYPLQATASDSDVSKASALSSALLVCTLVPWGICFVFYSMIHLTYPWDADRMASLNTVTAISPTAKSKA